MGSAALLYLVTWGSLLLDFSSAYGGYVGIINGTKVKEDSRPYMVSLQRRGKHVCGGFLVNERFVMTAAHCFYKGDTFWEVTVVLGSHNIEKQKPGSRKEVKEYYIHHKYNKPNTYDNDIALLQLEEGIKKSKSVSWIALPDKNKDIKAASDCSVAGWGATDTNGPANVNLLETNVAVMQRKECKKKWKSLTEQQVCARGEGGFCLGDSGGPLVCNGKAEGIVSFYQAGNCDKPTKPNVYTRVSAYLSWINGILKNPKTEDI